MQEDIFENLQHEIYDRCQKQTNKFGIGIYYHIVEVVNNAEILAEKYGADKEIVMIAAWLHDIASITDYNLYELHHIHGAEMAHLILKEYDYDVVVIAVANDETAMQIQEELLELGEKKDKIFWEKPRKIILS